MMQAATTPSSFQALVQASRARGRLAEPVAPEPKPKMVQTGMRLHPEEMDQARELAALEERSAASFIRRVYLRGLAAYLAEQGQDTATA